MACRDAFRSLLVAFAGAALPAAAAKALDFKHCLRELRAEATAAGISRKTFDTAMKGVDPDPSVLVAMGTQPELIKPVWDYLASLVDDKRIADGRARLEEWSTVLDEAEKRYGVDRHTVVAVWGVESDYGRILGKRPLVRSLATVSCFGERQKFFRGELLATFRILQSGDVKPDRLKGSWAGAFGQTQFMPSTFERIAVDFDGDGRRDIVGSVPDALASTANYLKQAEWVAGQPWGYEVRVPSTYAGMSGRRYRKPLLEWSRSGITRLDGGPLTGPARAALFQPAGAQGPAFIVFRNFDAIYAYNAAESYALAIAHLSDRLRGGGPIAAAWPTNDPGLSRAERREVQELLAKRGFDVGEPDGMIGGRTVDAIKAFQEKAGLPADGYPGQRLLKALKESPV